MTDQRPVPGYERQAEPSSPPLPARPSPLQALLAAETVLALVLVGIALAAVLSLVPGRGPADLEFFGLALLLIVWVIALSLGTVHLLRHRLQTLGLGGLALGLTGVLLGIALASATVGWALLGNPSDRAGLIDFLLRSAGISLAVAGAGIALVGNTLRWQQNRIRLQQAEFDGLQARVRPHFLFNALNTATALLPDQPVEAERVLLGLADLFRSALGEHIAHPLSEELRLTRHYLDIESLRFGKRLQLRWAISEPVPRLQVPPLCLQALAENAIHHGIEPDPLGGWIRIELHTDNHGTRVEVINSLPAQPATGSRAAGTRMGIAGNRLRLGNLLGPEARLDAWRDGQRHIARIQLPPQATTR